MRCPACEHPVTPGPDSARTPVQQITRAAVANGRSLRPAARGPDGRPRSIISVPWRAQQRFRLVRRAAAYRRSRPGRGAGVQDRAQGYTRIGSVPAVRDLGRIGHGVRAGQPRGDPVAGCVANPRTSASGRPARQNRDTAAAEPRPRDNPWTTVTGPPAGDLDDLAVVGGQHAFGPCLTTGPRSGFSGGGHRTRATLRRRRRLGSRRPRVRHSSG